MNYFTQFTNISDANNIEILLNDILVSKVTNRMYVVIYDIDLGFSVKDVENGTIEKLTKEVARSMEVKHHNKGTTN